MIQIIKDRVVTTLGAGGTELLTANGVECAGWTRLSFIIKNTGAAPITNVQVRWLDSFTVNVPPADWSPDDVGVFLIPPGTLAPGATIEYTITDLSRAKMRIIVTGTAGETIRLSLSATVA